VRVVGELLERFRSSLHLREASRIFDALRLNGILKGLERTVSPGEAFWSEVLGSKTAEAIEVFLAVLKVVVGRLDSGVALDEVGLTLPR
jgi:hypothetical protein